MKLVKKNFAILGSAHNLKEMRIKEKQNVDYLNATVDFLDRTIRQITNRTFTIKNAIDWRKFTSGAV